MKKLSEYLQETREKKGVSLAEVADATKIKKMYLQAIEEGKFSSLPSRSYVFGFVKTYGAYLDLPEDKVFALLRREYADKKTPTDVIPTYRKQQPKQKKSLWTSPKLFLGVLAVCIVAMYAISQYASLFFGPSLSIKSPQKNQVVTDNVVTVSGTTDPYATVIVEGEDTAVDLTGAFRKTLYEQSGTKSVTIVATNRFGKKTVEKIPIEVQ